MTWQTADAPPSAPSNRPARIAAAESGALESYRLVDTENCVAVPTQRLTDITTLASGGRVSGTLEPDSSRAAELVIYVGRERPMRPRLTAVGARQEPIFMVERLRADTADEDELHAAMVRDRVSTSHLPRPEDAVYRVALRPSASGPSSFRIDFGGLPRWAVASVPDTDGLLRSATICSASLSEHGLFGRGRSLEQIALGSRRFFGDGWHSPERVGTPDEYRWTGAAEAELLVPLARSGPARLRVQASAGVSPDDTRSTLAVRVNEMQLQAHMLRRRPSEYEWTIPAAALRNGINQVFLQSSRLSVPAGAPASRNSRRLGVRVAGLSLELLNDAR